MLCIACLWNRGIFPGGQYSYFMAVCIMIGMNDSEWRAWYILPWMRGNVVGGMRWRPSVTGGLHVGGRRGSEAEEGSRPGRRPGLTLPWESRAMTIICIRCIFWEKHETNCWSFLQKGEVHGFLCIWGLWQKKRHNGEGSGQTWCFDTLLLP